MNNRNDEAGKFTIELIFTPEFISEFAKAKDVK